MREILFRGKMHGKWYEGIPFFKGTDCYLIQDVFQCDEYFCIGTKNVEVIPETVGQYTGLTDKNGERIFEADIIQFDYVGTNRGVNGVGAVVFENGKFAVKWGWHQDLVCLDGFANTTLEVIGNIHDNRLEDFKDEK